MRIDGTKDWVARGVAGDRHAVSGREFSAFSGGSGSTDVNPSRVHKESFRSAAIVRTLSVCTTGGALALAPFDCTPDESLAAERKEAPCVATN